MTYVLFASGDLLMDRGYFYRNRKAEESLKDLIALGERQGVPIAIPE